jgi:integrase
MPDMPRRDSGKKNANGQGSIWQRADGRYGAALVYEYYDGAQGRTVKKRTSTTKPDWDAAHKWLVGKQSDLLGGVPVSDENPILSDFLGDWLRDVVEPSVSRNTYLKREYNVRVHLVPALGKVRIKDLDPRRIQALYTRLRRREPPLAASTRREVHVTLKMALSQAVRWGLLGRNPAELVDAPKEAKARKEDGEDAGEVRALTDAQARAFFRATEGKRWHHYYVAAIRTGLRPGELLGLRWGDLSLGADLGSLRVRRTLDTHEGAVFNPPKSDASRRTLALHWEAAEAFAAQREMLASEGLTTGPKDLVFPSTTGTPMSADNLRKRNLKPDLAAAGLPELTLHELRHTFASIMLHEWRVSPSIVQEMLGHEDITMTMGIYGHLFPGAQEDAIRALRRIHRRPPEEDVAVG